MQGPGPSAGGSSENGKDQGGHRAPPQCVLKLERGRKETRFAERMVGIFSITRRREEHAVNFNIHHVRCYPENA